MESRLRFLEDSLRRLAPEELDKAPPVSHAAFNASSMFLGQPYVTEPLETPAWPLQPQPQPTSRVNLAATGGMNNPLHQGVSSTNPSAVASVSPAASTEIGPGEPLAHEVGMLSLANSTASKYLGPSSGVPFARLIFSAIPQSQGLAANWTTPDGASSSQRLAQAQPFPQHWTSDVDLQHFVDAYFEAYQPFYPFLDEDAVADRLELLYTKPSPAKHSLQMPNLAEVDASLSPVHVVQMFLVVALGARILEVRLSSDFSSERYLATAMQRIGPLALHDSIEGLQIMLLLTLSSFYFQDGPNAWFLTSNIIASCLDLGFQRKWTVAPPHPPNKNNRQLLIHNNLRRGIFWSAYSLERTLAVVLGRPLTLRDEAIDAEFPGEIGPGLDPSLDAENVHVTHQEHEHQPKRARVTICPYTASQYSFRFDQIIAEIKLMLHRVVNLPHRFPWPTDIEEWKKLIQKDCDTLVEDLRRALKRRPRRNTSDGAIRSLELKYHHCLMLLHRPSPAVPRPSVDSWRTCYNSATATILLNLELHRFSKLSNSWLTAHTVFVSGITLLYCLWVNPEIQAETTPGEFSSIGKACTDLLQYLGKTWSVAADAVDKIERLVHMTTSSWKTSQDERESELAAGHSLVSMWQSQGLHSTKTSGSDGKGPGGASIDLSTLGSAEIHQGNGPGAEFESDFFFNELGDMSTWFDLDWLANPNFG